MASNLLFSHYNYYNWKLFNYHHCMCSLLLSLSLSIGLLFRQDKLLKSSHLTFTNFYPPYNVYILWVMIWTNVQCNVCKIFASFISYKIFMTIFTSHHSSFQHSYNSIGTWIASIYKNVEKYFIHFSLPLLRPHFSASLSHKEFGHQLHVWKVIY